MSDKIRVAGSLPPQGGSSDDGIIERFEKRVKEREIKARERVDLWPVPLRREVLILREKLEQSAGGILLAGADDQTEMEQCIVLMVGPDAECAVEEGDIVFCSRAAMRDITVSRIEMSLAPDEAILARCTEVRGDEMDHFKAARAVPGSLKHA